jgi:hypothetical protein
VTFRAIPGLNQDSELGEAVFPPAMTRKAIPSCNDPEGYSKSYIKAEHKTQKHINKIEAH